VVTVDLISRARGGDGDAFRALTEPHRRCWHHLLRTVLRTLLSQAITEGAATGIRHGTGLIVLTLSGDRICAMTRSDNSVLPWFGLPRSLPSR
jgi:RNA polymerase sigma-70 factor (ECF subfamily)